MGFVLFLVAFLALSVLATVIFALGASIGYRNGVDDVSPRPEERFVPSRLGIRADALASRRNRMVRRSWHGAPAGLGQTSGHRRALARTNPPRAPYAPDFGRPVPGPLERPTQRQTSPPPAGSRASLPSRGASRVAAALLATALVVAPTSVALASNSAPGGALWHAKRSSERIRLVLAQEPESQVRLHLQFAARRVSELTELMIDNAEPQVVNAVSEDLAQHVSAAAEGVQKFERARPETAALASESARHLSRHVTVLADLADIQCDDGSVASDHCSELEQTVATSSDAVAAVRREPAPAVAGPAVAAPSPDGADAGGDGEPSGVEATDPPAEAPTDDPEIDVANADEGPPAAGSEAASTTGEQLGSGAAPDPELPAASGDSTTPGSGEPAQTTAEQPTTPDSDTSITPGSGEPAQTTAEEPTTPDSDTPAADGSTAPGSDDASTAPGSEPTAGTPQEPTDPTDADPANDTPDDGGDPAAEDVGSVSEEPTPAAGASEPVLAGTPLDPASPGDDGMSMPRETGAAAEEGGTPSTAPTRDRGLPAPSGQPEEGASAPPVQADPSPEASAVRTPTDTESSSETPSPTSSGTEPLDEATPTPASTATEVPETPQAGDEDS